MTDHLPPLSDDEFVSLLKVGQPDRQSEIPQLHCERLVALGYAVRRLGELGPVDVCFPPKATEALLCSEMTREAKKAKILG
jgi:hypothetical protein